MLRSPVTQLSSADNYIYASTLRSSLFVLKVDSDTIRTIQADGMTRPSTCHFSCFDGYVIVADKNKHVVNLQRLNTYSSTMGTGFRLELPSVISKIKELKTEDDNNKNHSCIGKTLILSGVGGSLYYLKYLTSQETRFIQDLSHDKPMEFSPEPLISIYPGLQFHDSLMNYGVYDGDVLLAENSESLRLKDICHLAL